MQWFGESWGAHVCEGEHIATPIGAICFGSCGRPIAEGNRGVVLPFLGFEGIGNTPPDAAYHLDCFMRAVLGGGLVAVAAKPERHQHSGEVTIDRATGVETCDDCDPALK